jgi:predicted ATPase
VANTVGASSADGLVGREPELAVAALAVRELSEGRASVLAIEGEAGIGKTRLVQSIVADARSRDVAVYCGQAHPFERTRPFGVLATALDLSRRSPEPRRAALGGLLAGESAAGQAAGDIQFRVVEEIVDLVETSCAERPVLLVAEDIHWADSASLLAILSVARRLPLAALLVVVSARPSPQAAEVVRLLDDLAAGGARSLQLQPLTSDDVAVLARRTLGASPGPSLTAMLDKAGGNPLWVVALLRSLADGGMLGRVGDSVEPTTFELPVSLSDPAAPADGNAGAAAGRGGAWRCRVASRCRRCRRPAAGRGRQAAARRVRRSAARRGRRPGRVPAPARSRRDLPARAAAGPAPSAP